MIHLLLQSHAQRAHTPGTGMVNEACRQPSTSALLQTEAVIHNYDFKVDDAAMVLEQRWPFENAAVEIPFPPGKMAPVSGVYVSLM